MNRRFAAALVAASLFLGFTSAQPARAQAATGPSLQFTQAAGYPLAVEGHGWRPNARVVFWIRAANIVEGRELKTTAGGRFVIGITGLNMCAGPVFQSRDFKSARAKLRGPALGCAMPLDIPVPKLRIVVGQSVPYRLVKIYSHQPGSVTMHVGDQLYLWEPGTAAPPFTPNVDARYLLLIRAGKTPPRACPQPDCDAGYFWQYVGIRSGNTSVDMAASCRFSTPPCQLPDFAIEVVILP
jgi:hypothetical protein